MSNNNSQVSRKISKTLTEQPYFSNLDCEKYVISGVLRNPSVYFDILLEPSDFVSNKVHQMCWTVIQETLAQSDELDYRTIGLKLNELGIKFDIIDMSIVDYLESIYYLAAGDKSAIIGYAKKLKTLTVKREIAQTTVDIFNKVKFSTDDDYDSIITLADTTFYNKVNLFEQNTDNEPQDVFSDLQERIESDEEGKLELGIPCPYPIVRDLYGDFSPGGLFFFIARAKTGKSTFLSNLLLKCCLTSNMQVRGLYLDTELQRWEFQNRLLSAISGVPEYFIRSRKWKNNEEMAEKIRKSWKLIAKWFNLIDHQYVGGFNIDQVVSVIRRWYYKNIHPLKSKGEDINTAIVFDYVKLVADLSHQIKDYHMVGLICDKLKRLATELNCPILTAGQANRSNEARQSSANRIDDGSAVGLSDQISQFSTNVYLLNRFTVDEVVEINQQYNIEATHSLIPLYTRNQGANSQGFNDLVKIKDDKKIRFMSNRVFFSFKNFKVEELDSLASLVEKYDTVNFEPKAGEELEGGEDEQRFLD